MPACPLFLRHGGNVGRGEVRLPAIGARLRNPCYRARIEVLLEWPCALGDQLRQSVGQVEEAPDAEHEPEVRMFCVRLADVRAHPSGDAVVLAAHIAEAPGRQNLIVRPGLRRPARAPLADGITLTHPVDDRSVVRPNGQGRSGLVEGALFF